MVSEEPRHEISIKALERIETGGLALEAGRSVSVASSLACHLIMMKQAELSTYQTSAPLELLEASYGFLSRSETIGPTCVDPAILERFENRYLNNGSRRAIAEKIEVNWLKGYKELRKAFCEELREKKSCLGDVVSMIEESLETELKRSQKFGAYSGLTEQQMIAEGIITVRSHYQVKYLDGQSNPEFREYHVGEDWAKIHVGMGRLRSEIDARLQTYLAEGRILVVEQNRHFSQFLPPHNWINRRKPWRKGVDYYFVMSGTLPASWFANDKVLKGKPRAQALEKLKSRLQQIYDDLHPKGTILTKAEWFAIARNEFSDEFNVADRLVEQSWWDLDLGIWNISGRRPHKSRISSI